MAIDAEYFSVKEEIVIPDQLIDLFVYENDLYAVGNIGIYKMDMEFCSSTIQLQFDETVDKDAAYVNFSYSLDGKVYVFRRYAERKQGQKAYDYGHILKIDLSNFDLSETEVSHPKRTGLNNIFIIPTSFIKEGIL